MLLSVVNSLVFAISLLPSLMNHLNLGEYFASKGLSL